MLAPDGSQTYQKDRISSATLRPVSSVLFVDGKPYKGRYGRLSVTYHPSQKDGILTYHLPIFVDRVRDNPVKWLAKNRKFLETAAPEVVFQSTSSELNLGKMPRDMIRFKFEDFELIAGQKSVVFLGKDKDEDLVWREAFNPVDFRKVLAHSE